MEMTLIRMASPKLDSDNKALLRRISELELMIKSGSISVTAKAEAPKQEPKAENTSQAPEAQEESLPYDDVPPAEEPPQTPQSPSSDESVPFAQWAQVLSELKELNGGIWGILLGSEAYIRNDFVLINSDNPTFPMFIKQGSASRDVKEAIFRAVGKKYRLGIFKSSSAQVSQTATKQKDPLSDLISSARDMGVNVTVE